MWFECLLFQIFPGISWAEKSLYVILMLISSYSNEWVNLFCVLIFQVQFLSFLFRPFCFICSLSSCHSRRSCNTQMAPQENRITCSHEKACHNKQGLAGCEQDAEDERLNSGLPAGVCSTQTSCCHPLRST